MPSLKNVLKRKLDKVENALRPKGSVAYNIHHLSPHDRGIYENHRVRQREWAAQYHGEDLYIALLAAIDGTGAPLPELSPSVATKIYPVANKTDDPEQDYLNLLEATRCAV